MANKPWEPRGKVECAACWDEFESEACLRPAHAASMNDTITDPRKRLRMKNRIARLKTKLRDAERAQRKLDTQVNNLEDVIWPLREEIASLQNSLGLKVR